MVKKKRKKLKMMSNVMMKVKVNSVMKKKKSALRSVSRNLMGQLPPLPPSPLPPSKQQQHLLRRTISDPVPLTSSPDFQQEKQKGKKIEQAAVEAEKLSGEWFVVKFNCDCGEDNHYLVNASDSKDHKVLW